MDDQQQEVVRLLIEHRSAVTAYIFAAMRDSDAVEEVFQEVAVTICDNAASFKLGTNFKAWAREIARRRIAAYYRVRTRGPQSLSSVELQYLEDGFTAVESEATTQERLAALSQCLASLPPFVQKLFRMRYGLGHSLQQIADEVERQSESVRKALYRGRQALRACIETRL